MILQSIGRGLRVGGDAGVTTIYDVTDDLRGPTYRRRNFSLLHADKRMMYYKEAGFPYKITRMEL